MGSIDLTQDGGNAIQLGLKFFDFPSEKALDLTIRLYDSSEPSGLGYSDVVISLNQAVESNSPIFFNIPFSAFGGPGSLSIATSTGTAFPATVETGPAGAVEIKNVGAIQLTINGSANTNAPDLTLDNLKTDGRCEIVPNASGKVVDECGVCLNSPDAKLGKDRCGVCLAGPPGYSYAQNNKLDVCGVCSGDGKSCLDCNGIVFGKAKVDACGTCGGTVASALECGKSCSLVAATAEVLEFEKRLLKQAKTLRARYQSDVRRVKQNKCAINLKPISKEMNRSYELIRDSAKEIFQQGIEVCSDSCVTVSYAEKVQTLTPEFQSMEFQAKRLAKLVQKCYRRIGKTGKVGGPGLSTTIATVRTGLNELIEDCRNRQVCPQK